MGHVNGEMQATWDIRVGKCWHHGLRYVTHSSVACRKNQKRNQLELSVPGKKTGALCPEFLNGKLQDINQSVREVIILAQWSVQVSRTQPCHRTDDEVFGKDIQQVILDTGT